MMPGQLLAIAALLGVVVFVTLCASLHVDATQAAWIAVLVTFVVRVLAVRYNWRTRALVEPPS